MFYNYIGDNMKNKVFIIIVNIVIIALTVLGIILLKNSTESVNYDYEKIMGKSFVMKDESYIVFNKDKTFIWYKTKDDLEDNYYEGTYTVYRGENAIKYISNDLSKYAVTEKEQRDLLKRNEDIKIDMYYNLNLVNKKLVMNKEEKKLDYERHYYGYSNEEYNYFTLLSMDTANYAYLTLDE